MCHCSSQQVSQDFLIHFCICVHRVMVRSHCTQRRLSLAKACRVWAPPWASDKTKSDLHVLLNCPYEYSRQPLSSRDPLRGTRASCHVQRSRDPGLLQIWRQAHQRLYVFLPHLEQQYPVKSSDFAKGFSGFRCGCDLRRERQ